MSATAKDEHQAPHQQTPLDAGAAIEAIRTKLAAIPGKAFWRGLEEVAQTPAFQSTLQQEFPRQAQALASSAEAALSRRAFLTVMGASLALAGLSGCGARPTQDKIVPYLDQPDGLEPGKALFYATAMAIGGSVQGILVASREGRPIKIDGNPTHPSNLGATDALAQASLLSLYDSDRSQAVLNRGVPVTWDEFLNAATQQMQALQATGGAGLRILSGATTSPTIGEQMQTLLTQYPNARWCQHEPIGRENTRTGAQMAFGTDVTTFYHLDKAEIIVSLDGDFLLTLPGHVRYAVDFGKRRTARTEKTDLNRLYVAESAPTITGAMAEHRLRLRPGQIELIARSLTTEINTEINSGAKTSDTEHLPLAIQSWVAAASQDCRAIGDVVS